MILFCHLQYHSYIWFSACTGNFIVYIFLWISPVRMMRTEYNIINIGPLPAKKHFHFPVNMRYIRSLTHSPCHDRLVCRHNGKIAAFIDKSYCLRRRFFQFKCINICNQSFINIQCTIPVHENTFLFMP